MQIYMPAKKLHSTACLAAPVCAEALHSCKQYRLSTFFLSMHLNTQPCCTFLKTRVNDLKGSYLIHLTKVPWRQQMQEQREVQMAGGHASVGSCNSSTFSSNCNNAPQNIGSSKCSCGSNTTSAVKCVAERICLIPIKTCLVGSYNQA